MSSIPRHAESAPRFAGRVTVATILTAFPHVVTDQTEMVRSEEKRRTDWYATQAARAKAWRSDQTDTNWIPRVSAAVAR